jgi:hypothetical protein
MPARLAIKRQPIIHSPIERPTRLALRRIGIRINNHRNIGMTLAETAQQMLKLGINDNRIHLSMIENVLNILLLQPVIDGNLDSTRGSNTVNRFQEGGRVGG